METPIYIVKIKNPETQEPQERKAIDIEHLKNFIDAKKFEFSLLNIDTSKLDPETKLIEHIAHSANAILSELCYTLDTHLGLIPVEKEPVAKETPEPNMDEIPPSPHPVAEPVVSKTPQPKIPASELDKVDNSEENIII